MRKENVSKSVPEEAAAVISAAHLLHPAKHFDHPRDVLASPDIGKEEKRAILASWASDIFAIESIPALRLYPGADKEVSYDEIMEALKALDEDDQRAGDQDSAGSINHARRRKSQARWFGGFDLCRYWKGDRRRQPFEM
ncbi:hypothetical protein [Rhizobium sp. NXC24]|uniref:hypothetical protein n=1 Tax=Rhizobium sp. NXC24 TaxID=2048897 RepID=UPI000CDF3BCB|nr:hypothetical protein [Rhizobium sp. NXC24]AVA24827.1 hypothetical protein NXC24_PC00380 [Rhizobium sp. NXC24]